MLFNSYIFIFAFLPLMLGIYFLLLRFARPIDSKIALIVGSFVFYGYWNLKYIPILLGSILINYTISKKLIGGGGRRIYLFVGISFNLALLGFFKYTDFLIQNLNFVFDSHYSLLKLTLPLAISFFTFQQIAYLYDSYKDRMSYAFVDYCLFVVFFPQLISGPIVNHKEMIPQFQNLQYKWLNLNNFTQGFFIFSIGLFKKVVVADSFAIYANNGFNTALSGVELNFFECWLSSLSYSFQLYFDFSGYCDMAIGIALFFNLKLPINFNSPYKALNIQEFWKRWHMTLGRFLTTYLYIPLGGSKGGKLLSLRNIFIVFVLSGIWHGAGWGFILWGTLHALAMMLHRIYSYLLAFFHLNASTNVLYRFFCWFLTFNFVNASWVFFRAENLQSGMSILKGMLGLNGIVFPSAMQNLMTKLHLETLVLFFYNPFLKIAPTFLDTMKLFAVLFPVIPVVFFFKNSIELSKKMSYGMCLIVSFLWWYALIKIGVTPYQEFLYFNF